MQPESAEACAGMRKHTQLHAYGDKHVTSNRSVSTPKPRSSTPTCSTHTCQKAPSRILVLQHIENPNHAASHLPGAPAVTVNNFPPRLFDSWRLACFCAGPTIAAAGFSAATFPSGRRGNWPAQAHNMQIHCAHGMPHRMQAQGQPVLKLWAGASLCPVHDPAHLPSSGDVKYLLAFTAVGAACCIPGLSFFTSGSDFGLDAGFSLSRDPTVDHKARWARCIFKKQAGMHNNIVSFDCAYLEAY